MSKGIGLGFLLFVGIAAVTFIPELRNKVFPKGFGFELTPSQTLNFGGPSQSSSIARILGFDNGSVTGTEIIKQNPQRPERIL